MPDETRPGPASPPNASPPSPPKDYGPGPPSPPTTDPAPQTSRPVDPTILRPAPAPQQLPTQETIITRKETVTKATTVSYFICWIYFPICAWVPQNPQKIH